MFTDTSKLLNQGAIDDRSRLFIVDNGEYILVPDLIELEGVEIDGVDIPLESERPMAELTTAGMPETVISSVPMVQVCDLPGVGRILQRSAYSNHGIWQIGSRVVIRGEWAAGPEESFISSTFVDEKVSAAEARAKAAEDELAKMKADKAKADAGKAGKDKAGG